MLAPRASSAFMCIRCELQLARPRVPTFGRRTAHASFSASSRSRNEEPPTDSPIAEPQSQSSSHPFDRIRKRKGRTVKQSTARLGGIKTLGADAEIIVLQEVTDAISEQPEVATPAPEETQEHQSAAQILASLQQDNESLTTAEILNQIDNLRPKIEADPDGRCYVTRSAFVKLEKALTRSFKAPQLSQYYTISRGVYENNAQKVLGGLATRDRPVKQPVQRTDWHPGTTQINRRLPVLDSNSRPIRKPVNKKLLVDQILRHAWKLVLLEEIENPGEIELSVKPWQLILLNSGENGSELDAIGRFRMAKLEIHWPDNVIRITADKNTAEYAANDIEQLVQNIETRRFHVTPWLPRLAEDRVKNMKTTGIFSKADIKKVASLSRTVIQAVSDDKFIIRACSSSSADQAEASLRRLLPLKQSTTYTVDNARFVESTDSSYLVPTSPTRSLDWQFRKSNLGRWILPVKKYSEAGSSQEVTTIVEDAVEGDHVDTAMQQRALALLRQSLEGSVDWQHKGLSNMETGFWNVEPEYKISAQFGQALFPLEDGHSGQATHLLRNSSHTFLHEFPGLFKLLTGSNFVRSHRTKHQVLEYEFVAAPAQPNFPDVQTYPSLSVQFRYDSSGQPYMHKLSLGVGVARTHDVLLPGKVADIRFNQYTRLTRLDPTRDASIHDFNEAVCSNINSGARLSAPTLRLHVPTWTIPGVNFASVHDTLPVTYLFSHVQFRQPVLTNNERVRLSYDTVESGELGRRGGMLTAYYEPYLDLEAKRVLKYESTLEKFIKQSFGIVDDITRAAQSNQTLGDRMKKQRHESSARRLRRQALNEGATVDNATIEGDGQGEAERSVSDIEGVPYTLSHETTDTTLMGDDAGVVTPEAEEGAQGQDQRTGALGDAEPTNDSIESDSPKKSSIQTLKPET